MRRDQVLPGSVSSSVRGLLPEAQNLEGKIFEKKTMLGQMIIKFIPFVVFLKEKCLIKYQN